MDMNKKKQNNKGFSLVELIIVMAIMAILVGAIAPQVFQYVEASRESSDLRMVDTVFTAVHTVIGSQDTAPADFNNTLDAAITKWPKIGTLLASDMKSVDAIQKKAKSKLGKNGTVFVVYTASTGKLVVFLDHTYTAASTYTAGTTTVDLGPVTN